MADRAKGRGLLDLEAMDGPADKDDFGDFRGPGEVSGLEAGSALATAPGRFSLAPAASELGAEVALTLSGLLG